MMMVANRDYLTKDLPPHRTTAPAVLTNRDLECLPRGALAARLRARSDHEIRALVDGAALTPDEARIARQMGNDPAEVLKTKRAHLLRLAGREYLAQGVGVR